MNVSSDTKTLYMRINDLEARQLYERIFKRNKVGSHPRWRFFTEDRLNAVKVGYGPTFPTTKFNVWLSFNGYSNNSALLRDVFDLLPLERWMIKRLDIAFDNGLPYEQKHAIHPAKRADVKALSPTSMYMGSRRSPVQLASYDKQKERHDKFGKVTDKWTRTELRFRFPSMIKVADLKIEDFSAAKDYQIITDISGMPQKLQEIVRQLNRGVTAGGIEWKDVTRTYQAKIREYGITQGLNLYDLILSNVADLPGFIYTPVTRANERTS